MHAQHVLRTLGDRRDRINVEIGGVGRQHCARLGVGIERGKYLFLHRHGFEHRLDDQIGILDVFEPDHAGDQRHAFGRRIGRQTATRRTGLIVLLHDAEAALQRLFAGFDQRHRNAGIGKRHRDTAAHGAGADHRNLGDWTRLGAFRHARDLGGFTLGKERVALRLGLIADHQFEKAVALALHALIKRQIDRGADRISAGERRLKAPRLLGHRGHGIGEDRPIGARRGELAVIIAQPAQRPLLGQHLARERFAASNGVFDHFVDQTMAERFCGTDRITTKDHLYRELRANRARQALRTARPGQQPELHLRQAELGALDRNAEVTAERGFQAAAERGAVDRGDDRFRRGVERIDHFMQAGRLRRLAKFGDVSPGDEGAAGTGEYDRLHLGVRDRRIDLFEDAATNCRAQRVDRRIVDRDDGDAIPMLRLHNLAHPRPP